ncbi:type I restriction enzyme HsdR N-terminal domain-containing protein [Chelatococcus sambhunathii]|uniref:Type I restriction enzyme HsdR N-terminal domain-containing protein n=1 Tax=Chelatococcus sambhunathii TaxID=363953 RepID=A0ABU1DD28_9HYPH|nr:type I restriction enzyme HsdR N-terminal domain-containing protein [Chelatococcus sambhunathii]
MPLLRNLGYAKGTENDIRREVSLKYSREFLGHKKPTDPELRGRADYICEARGFGRWTIEAKGPNEALTLEDAHQAHSYTAHPEIGGCYSVVTNGREFRVYRFAQPETPAFTWRAEETGERLMEIRNVLGPDAIKRYTFRPMDPGKPLAEGYGPRVTIIGGSVVYDHHKLGGVENDAVPGFRATPTGRAVQRNAEGKIVGELELAAPIKSWDDFNKLAGIEFYTFETADEFVSTDPAMPTIFQGLSKGLIKAGTPLPDIPNLPAGMVAPMDFAMNARTQAIGYLEDGRFRGTFEIDYGIMGQEVLTADGTFDIFIK